MATESAKFKLRNRTIEIKWFAQYCDHIMDNFINKNTDHDLKFMQISKLLRTCTKFEKITNRKWFAYNTLNGTKYRIVFILDSKFAIVTTCHRYGYPEN